MNRLLLAAAPILIVSAGSALAQGMGDPYGDATVTKAEAQAKATQMFEMVDANHDGKISSDEIDALGPMGRMLQRLAGPDGSITKADFLDRQGTRFDESDANHDGQLTKAERDAARVARMQAMQNGQGEGPK